MVPPDGKQFFCGKVECEDGYKKDLVKGTCEVCLTDCTSCLYSSNYFLIIGSKTCHHDGCPLSTTVEQNSSTIKTCKRDTVLLGKIYYAGIDVTPNTRLSLIKDEELYAEFSYFDPLQEVKWNLEDSSEEEVSKFFKDTIRTEQKLVIRHGNLVGGK